MKQIKKTIKRTGNQWIDCLRPDLKEKLINHIDFVKNNLKYEFESFTDFMICSLRGWPYDWEQWISDIYYEATAIEEGKQNEKTFDVYK